MNPIPELAPQLKQLRLSGILDSLEARNRQALDGKLAYTEFLSLLIQDEVARREHKKFQMRLRRATFRATKTLEQFDFERLPKLNRTLVHELKYRGRRRIAGRLAAELLAAPRIHELLEGDVVLVPVPLHPRKRRERGFNQSELVAAEIASRTGRPLAPRALVRRKDTAPQSDLSAAERRRNVAGAFAVRERARVVGRVVVLVDDVWTTGATARACARILREAGAAQVRLLSLARVA